MGAILVDKFGFNGIKRIEIPKTDSDFATGDFGLETIKKYLPNILATHKQNAVKEKLLYDFFLGKQDISNKKRLYDKDSENNNKIVENHAFRQVNFKVGMITGEKRDYTYKVGSKGDDLKYLDYYFTDVDFFGKDKELKEWIYATGLGVSYVGMRMDLIVADGVDAMSGQERYRYKNADDGYDVKSEAPFEYSILCPYDNFVVYSSGRTREPLFCVSIVDIDVGKDDKIETRKQIQIETKYATFKTDTDLNYGDIKSLSMVKLPKALQFIPMVEHSINQSRQGIVELNYTLFNSINTLVSNVVDMIVDNANVILVFKNTDVTRELVLEMKKGGAIIIKDSDGAEADLSTIKIEIPFDGLNNFYEQRISQTYDIAGVPLASGQVTSGGDTGQARLLGGGWNNAYTMANNDITTLLKYDYMVLKQILMICRQIPNNPVNELTASQIDIKYRINQNDNFLVKAQGIAQLAGVRFPKEEIVKASGLFSDTNTVAMKWRDEENEALARGESEAVNGNIGKTDTLTTEPTAEDEQGNNSQE